MTEALKAEIAEKAKEYEIVKARIKELDEKVSSIDELEKIVNERKEEYTSLLESSKNTSSEQKSERETMMTQVTEMRVKLAGYKANLDSIDQELNRYNREKQSLEEDKIDCIADLKREEQNLANIENCLLYTSPSPRD